MKEPTKEMLFAQYYGQEICEHPMGMCLMKPFEDDEDFEHYRLLLKPLSSITDVELESMGLAFLGTLFYDEADLLRSKGYALPYMGISVKQQVQKGWIKLIK